MVMSPRIQGSIAAGLMTVLTLSVFGAAQNQGPESAVKRYHEAVRAGNLNAVSEVTSENPRAGQPAGLHLLVRRLLDSGAQVRFGGTRKNYPEALVEVAYVLPNGEVWAWPYVTRLQAGRWRIDSIETIRMASSPMGGADGGIIQP